MEQPWPIKVQQALYELYQTLQHCERQMSSYRSLKRRHLERLCQNVDLVLCCTRTCTPFTPQVLAALMSRQQLTVAQLCRGVPSGRYRQKIRQIMRNLCQEALHALESGGTWSLEPEKKDVLGPESLADESSPPMAAYVSLVGVAATSSV